MSWQDLFTNADLFKEYLIGLGPYAPLAFIAIQALQVIVAPFPGEITGAIGGYVFGGLLGSLYATIGLAIGSTAAYGIAHLLGKPLVAKLIGQEKMKKLDVMLHANSFFAMFIVFLLPGFPKDVASYFVGVSPIPFRAFFPVTQLARLPGTILLCYTSGAVAERDWSLLSILSLATLLIVGLSFRFRFQLTNYFLKAHAPEQAVR